MSVAQTPENYKTLSLEEERASGSLAEASARWLLCSSEEDAAEWLDRVAERLNPFALGPARARRESNTRLAWAKALVLAQAWTMRAEEGVWERAVALFDDGAQDRDALEKNLRAAAATVRAFPAVCAATLGLDPGEVWRACGGAGEPNPLPFDPGRAARELGFRVFLANRSRPQAIAAELAARLAQMEPALEGVGCQGLRVIPADEEGLLDAAQAPDDACQEPSIVLGVSFSYPQPDKEKIACQGLRVIPLPPIPPAVAALRESEAKAAEALAALVRASRVARAEDPEAADSALARTVSLLASECMADWEVARLLRLAQERMEAAEDAAMRIAEQAESEAAQIRAAAWREAEEARQAAAAAATVAYRTLAWREVEEKVARLLDRYRLRLAPQEDGLNGYRETVRVAAIARRAIPMVVDATLSRLFGRAGADLAAVIWSDFGAAEAAAVNVDLIARHAEELAAVMPDLGLAQEHAGLPEELAALDYPRTASGFVSVAEALAARRGGAQEETRAAVAAARSGRGRPVVPVAP